MVDKSNLLSQMRKHAQTFSSAVSSPLVVDEANINRALVLIDVAARDSGLGVLRKMSFKTPALLKNLRLEKNLIYLKTEIKKRKWWINQISYVRCVNMLKHFLLQYHPP